MGRTSPVAQERRSVEGFDRGHGVGGGLLIDIVDDDRCALSGELLSVGEAQASARPGDNGDFALQRHGAPLLLEALSAVAECA